MNRSKLPLADRIRDALRLVAGRHTVRCPYPGCFIQIRYGFVTPDEAKRLTALAVDHAHH
ncbi:hypothetical protein OHA91_25830 [Streptomyces erythrochromogenes]|uniref:Uncharacterized protein n=1 Tax=Streptomyces erythrochromogenes TaxID=285574 RepID=A0ABZ1QG51_9ACTN|nr:hypothetical protein [Streptomyces erythrochromogenes]